MKTKLLALALVATLPLTAPVFFSGCAESGYQKTVDTKNEVLTFQDSLSALSTQIGSTNNLLTALVSDTKTNPEQRYKDFAAAVDKTVDLDAKARTAADAVQASARQTVEQRRAEGATITDDTLRAQLEKQATDYAQRFDNVKKVTGKTASSVKDYVAKLTDLKTSLGSNLSPAGLTSAQSFASKAVESGNEAFVNINELKALIGKVAGDTAPSTTLSTIPASQPSFTY